MEWISIIAILIISIGIYNVWIIRFGKSSTWRGGDAENMKEEFTAYGLPDWMLYLVGGLKLIGATLLILSIWYPRLAPPAAILIALLMTGAILMHLKIGDPIKKSLPAFTLLVLSLIIILA